MPGQEAVAGTSVIDSRVSKRRKRSRTTPSAIAARERAAEVVRLRRNGMSWDAIARTLGFGSDTAAHTAFKTYMDQYPVEDVESARQLELDRLDAMQLAIWQRCLDSNDDNQHWAIDRMLKISDQRARLMGLNKPVRQEITVLSASVVQDATKTLQARLQQTALAAGIELSALPAYAEVLDVMHVE